jgi:hypothetical protein
MTDFGLAFVDQSNGSKSSGGVRVGLIKIGGSELLREAFDPPDRTILGAVLHPTQLMQPGIIMGCSQYWYLQHGTVSPHVATCRHDHDYEGK